MMGYRVGEGMLAWIFHRVSGVAIWAFVVLHVIDIYLAGSNPSLYDELLSFYASPVGRVLETLLGAALLYHALNGARIIVTASNAGARVHTSDAAVRKLCRSVDIPVS